MSYTLGAYHILTIIPQCWQLHVVQVLQSWQLHVVLQMLLRRRSHTGADAHVSRHKTMNLMGGSAWTSMPISLSYAEVQTGVCMLAGSAAASGLMSHVELTIAFVCGSVCSIVGIMLHLACDQHSLLFPVVDGHMTAGNQMSHGNEHEAG